MHQIAWRKWSKFIVIVPTRERNDKLCAAQNAGQDELESAS